MKFMERGVKIRVKYTGVSISILILLLCGCSQSKEITLKKQEFESEVNHDVSKNVATYFNDYKGNDEVVVRKSDVNIKKLGSYHLTFTYKGKDYPITITVIDHEKPVIKLKQPLLVIPLDDPLQDAQKRMYDNLMITDNYDTHFPPLTLLKEMPKEEKELVFAMQVKDSSVNLSNKVNMRVQFTKNGKQKDTLKKEEVRKSEIVNGQSSEKKVDVKKHKQEDKPIQEQPQNGHKDTNPVIKEAEPPRPPALDNVEEKPSELPMLIVDNFPSFALGNSGRVFTTYEEAYVWANEQVTTLGNPCFEYQMVISNPFLPGYANTGMDNTPYTVSFWNYGQ